MADQIGTIKTPRGVTKDAFLDQVRAGVHDAMRELMTTGTANPSADFYTAVRDGIAEAVKAVARDREATTGGPSAPVSYDTPRDDPSTGGVQP